jgi:signal transduction histidine kinase/CheY-like chemotaxis protein
LRPTTTRPIVDSERVLVLAPRDRDADLTTELLAREQVAGLPCTDVSTLCRRLEEGAGAAILVEEVLTDRAIDGIAQELARQPPWSDFPFVILTAPRAGPAIDDIRWGRLGNVAVLERPVRVPSMVAAVRAALRTRKRQYDARRAIEARDQFLAMLGHELRNPLAAVRLAASLLARSGGDSVAAARHRSVIERQTNHLARLIDDLLDVARVTYGKISLRPEPVNLDEIIRASAQAFEQTFRAGNVSLHVSVQPKLFVRGDRVRLEQVLANLLNNAIKYTPAGGSVELSGGIEGGSAVVRVTDSGIGLDGEVLQRVFDMFTQVDESLDRSQGGLGIGLTLVRSLVQLHGGTVHAMSAGLGRGSEFRVVLPLATPPGDRGDSEPQAMPPVESRARIVLVEDGEDVRSMLQELLEVEGHTVFTAADGPRGVERILEVEPDLAFVDIGLPGFDGYEVARRVRANGSRALLIALTGYGQDADRVHATAAGFNRHLTKPIELEHIQGVLVGLGKIGAIPISLEARRGAMKRVP